MVTVKVVRGHYPDGRKVLIVESPFHPNFPAEARRLGGRWQPNSRNWVFDRRDEAELRNLLQKTYGTDGTTKPELLAVELDLDGGPLTLTEDQLSIFFGGREIARAFHRDGLASLGEGVRLLRGEVYTGGSRRHPSIAWTNGTVLLVRDVPGTLVNVGEHVRLCEAEAPASPSIPDCFSKAFDEPA